MLFTILLAGELWLQFIFTFTLNYYMLDICQKAFLLESYLVLVTNDVNLYILSIKNHFYGGKILILRNLYDYVTPNSSLKFD